MKQVLLFCCLLGAVRCIARQDPEQEIRRILAAQTEQWNKGDLAGFMEGYWKSDSLLFVGKSGPRYGYASALANYRRGYPDTAAMGKLRFTILRIQPLAADCYFVLGKWELTRSIEDVAGHYTLIFRKIGGQWVIVADHSS